MYSEGGMRLDDIRIDLKPLTPVPTKILHPFSPAGSGLVSGLRQSSIKKHLPLVVAVNGLQPFVIRASNVEVKKTSPKEEGRHKNCQFPSPQFQGILFTLVGIAFCFRPEINPLSL